MQVDTGKLNAFMGKVLVDVGAMANASLIRLGDRLSLYKTLASKGPMTAAELAAASGTTERYIREWLAAQAASGYVDYDSASATFSMNAEQAMVFADEDSPIFLAAIGDLVAAMVGDGPKIEGVFRTGQGLGWNDRTECLFCGTARFFRTTYKHYLVQEWLPVLDGIIDRLNRGARVADIGCGHGISTALMAKAFPNSQFAGFDPHPGSIDAANENARKEGVGGRTAFAVATAKTVPAGGYDLVCFFDCLHDMGDPVGALKHVRSTMAADGICMVVEPFAGDRIEDNLNPVGRVYYAASTMVCTPASLSQEVGLALGAQAGQKRLTEVANAAGFSRVRRAAETPFNIVLELRP